MVSRENGILQDGMNLYKAGKLTASRDKFTEILLSNPVHADANHMKGILAFKEGNIAEAIPYVQKAIENSKNNNEYYNTLGVIYNNSSQFSKAAVCYKRILDRMPSHVPTLNNLANTFIQMGMPEKALTCSLKAWDAEPENILALNKLATVYYKLGNFTKSHQKFLKSLHIEPNNIDALTGLGMVHIGLGEKDKAREYFNQALDIAPNSLFPCYQILKMNKSKEGDKLFSHLENQLTKQDLQIIDKISIHFMLGDMYKDVKNYSKSFNNFHNGNTLDKALRGTQFH